MRRVKRKGEERKVDEDRNRVTVTSINRISRQFSELPS